MKRLPWAIIIGLLLLAAWMLPTYRKSAKTAETYRSAWETEHSENISLRGKLENYKHSASSEKVTGYLQEPVFGPDGKAVMRTVRWTAAKSSDVTESVRQALAMFEASSSHSVETVEKIVTKEVIVTKRGFGEIGLGKADQNLWAGMLGMTLHGALGAWTSAFVDLSNKKVDHISLGAKLQF